MDFSIISSIPNITNLLYVIVFLSYLISILLFLFNLINGCSISILLLYTIFCSCVRCLIFCLFFVLRLLYGIIGMNPFAINLFLTLDESYPLSASSICLCFTSNFSSTNGLSSNCLRYIAESYVFPGYIFASNGIPYLSAIIDTLVIFLPL